MELQELVERIQRWKTRMASESPEGMEEEGYGDETEDEMYGSEGDEPAVVSADDLEFEEMEIAEIQNGDSEMLEEEEEYQNGDELVITDEDAIEAFEEEK
jgi:hypothetical protein